MLSRFHLIPERYGQTDGRRDRRTELLYQSIRNFLKWPKDLLQGPLTEVNQLSE